MKKLASFLVLFVSIFFFASCDDSELTGTSNISTTSSMEEPSNASNTSSTEKSSNTSSGTLEPSSSTEPDITLPSSTTIYLAGDSTVQTYNDNQVIAGWGQYLNLYLNENVKVVNCARGGRSSRSFINEGRLFDIPGCNYTFTENKGKSIESVITEGDYLFIQFGHNDDDTKLTDPSHFATLYDRMSPLGTPVNGIYPITEPTKKPTTHLPQAYIDNVSSTSSALTEIAKYGSEYYAYDSNGTYKWYLKQYIDLVRSKGAIPVLVTPVARLKLDASNKLVSGAGLHGENFAYVEAVRQLASEEDCLLVDLFSSSKTTFETATTTYADYLMSLRTDTVRTWPSGYDESLIEKTDTTEATHYNKYGAFLQAAMVAELILKNDSKHNASSEYFAFKSNILKTPASYLNPSNLISKSIINSIEALYSEMKVTDPSRTYPEASLVINKINEFSSISDMTNDNYLTYKEKCEEIRAMYYRLNVDDRSGVTNLSILVEFENKVKEFILANTPVPTSVVVFNVDDIATGSMTSNYDAGNGFNFVATSAKNIEIKAGSKSFKYNNQDYTVSKYFDFRGAATFGSSGARYISFETTSACKVTIVANSSADGRILNIADSSNKIVGSADAPLAITVTTVDIDKAGTYQIGSAGSGIYLYSIIIEYFD